MLGINGRIFDEASAVRDEEAMLGIGARWALPGQNLPIWDGEEFNCRVTFQHRGPADRVRAQFTLKVGSQYPGRIGEWMSVPEDTSWATHTVEMGPVMCKGCEAIGEGWHLDGDVLLFSEAQGEVWRDMVDNGFVTLRLPTILEYSVLPAASSVEVWSPRG